MAEGMADAAAAWLAGLDASQLSAAVFPWPSDEERHRWHYTPVDHGGLPLGSMDPAQQQAAMRLVSTGLSAAGYASVATIMGLENVLDAVEGWGPGRRRPAHRVEHQQSFARRRDPARYYLRVFGTAGDARWSWRFGGHHVSVQHVIVDGAVVGSTPCFLGANPASSPLLGEHPLRPLAGVEDPARELVCALDASQAARAVLPGDAPSDILTGNLPRVGEALQPLGLPAAALTPDQQALLRTLLHRHTDRLPDELAARAATRFAGGALDAVHVAWAGSTEPGRPHYYRVQGPRLLVEYDNTQNDANHAHSVWRDPENDFGDDVLAAHH